VTLTTRPLGRPARFEPQQLAEWNPTGVIDEHARQLAAAMNSAREEGLLMARAEVEAAVAAHDGACRDLEAAAAALLAASLQLRARDQDDLTGIEDQVIRFGVELAEQLVGRELASCDDVLVASISRAMGLVPERGEIVLRVNPLDAAHARAAVDGTADLAGRTVIINDSLVERGGCITVVGALRIDAQLNPALGRVRDVVAPA
jgi:flagellar assembly protein FliH